MKMQNSIKLSWIVCGLGWVIAIISLAFLPDAIPTKFSDGVPGNFSDKYSIFLWPLIQVIVMLLGANKTCCPGSWESCLLIGSITGRYSE